MAWDCLVSNKYSPRKFSPSKPGAQLETVLASLGMLHAVPAQRGIAAQHSQR